MTDSATLRALAERCEKASGPDRELDGLVGAAMGIEREGQHWWWSDAPGHCHFGGLPRFTESLDAAVALTERVLPGQAREICRQGVERTLKDFGTAALARNIVAATLRALAASKTTGGASDA